MDLKLKYQELASRNNSIADIEEIKKYRDLCIQNLNLEYQYYYDLLIVDIYIENHKLDEALNNCTKNIDRIDPNLFRTIYLSFLERIIYVYIQKKNYNIAHRYANMKKDYIDVNNSDEINRWYLETAYIYAELNNKIKALTKLKAIINNNPQPELLSLVYSNMTKLHLDLLDLNSAKESLNKCLEIVYDLNDIEGKTYCEYLLAKLYTSEKNYRYALKTYNDLFKGKKEISKDYLSISLEYVDLLLELAEYDDANKFILKHSEEYETSDDLEIQLHYYKASLKIQTNKNKYVKDSLPKLLDKIDALEKKLALESEVNQNNVVEDDKNFEVYINLKETNDKLESMINSIAISLAGDTIRSSLLDFGKSLNSIVRFDEFQVVIFDKSKFEPVIELFDSYNNIDSYQYKKNKLYERVLSFNQVPSTVFELLIANRSELTFDFSDSSVLFTDIISKKAFEELRYKYLLCLPLFSNNEIFGGILYLSETNDITSVNEQVVLKMASKLLESKLLDLYYQENLRSQKNILQNSLNALQEGIFYYKPESNDIVLTEQSKSFLGVDSKRLTKEDFYKMIDESDRDNYASVITNAVNVGSSYRVSYHLNTDKEKMFVEEVSSPYITKLGEIKFYVSAFHKLAYKKTLKNDVSTEALKQSDFNAKIEQIANNTTNIEYKVALVRFKVFDLENFEYTHQNAVVKEVHSCILNTFETNVYYLIDKTFVVFLEKNFDIRTIEKNIAIVLNSLDKGLIVNEDIINFKSSSSVIRYPRDTLNIDDLLKFSSYIIDKDNRITIFNEDIYKKFLKRESISNIVRSQLSNDKIELLLRVLESPIPSHELQYNIRGLISRDDVNDYLDRQLAADFETRNINTVLRQLDRIDGRLFIQAHPLVLDRLIKNNKFNIKDKTKYQNICFVISKYDENITTILSNLRSYGFNIYIDYKLFEKIELGWFIKNNIQGIYINEAIESNARIKLLSIFKVFNYEIFSNYEFQDYSLLVYRTEKVKNFNGENQ